MKSAERSVSPNQVRSAAPDQSQRERALAPGSSVLVQAPAGSGKTDLLTRRFLRLLSEVDDPAQLVAITFTKAAAAEMRHRIIAEIEKAAESGESTEENSFSMPALAARALARLTACGWQTEDIPAMLRIDTIDAFCREIAMQQPLLSGMGGALEIAGDPEDLYRRAARNTLNTLAAPPSAANSEVRQAIEALLEWRDNNWQELEDQLVEMLGKRDRWMHGIVLDRAQDWDALRARLERPFVAAAEQTLAALCDLLQQLPLACEEALALARFACAQKNDGSYQSLAELAELPGAPFVDADTLKAAHEAYLDLADLLLTADGTFRQKIDVRVGFPADRKQEKQRFIALIKAFRQADGLEAVLHSVRTVPPARYTDDEWRIVRACFVLLRHAAAHLHVVFAEAGATDFTEVAQQAQRVLEGEDRMPTDAGLAIADGIRHLLVDEFQDTSRRQHRLIASIAAAWPDNAGRSVFVVGDPMQSIYLFRSADAELFAQVRARGIDLPNGDALRFDFVQLSSNFRTAPPLVHELNGFFDQAFAEDDGSGIRFAHAEAARAAAQSAGKPLEFHCAFTPEDEANSDAQATEIVALIESRAEQMRQARERGEKYRIAVLGRTTKILTPIAAALRQAGIPFRAQGLEELGQRAEVLDALALAGALMNGEDRVAWLGVLRAPWCALSLADLHTLTSADDRETRRRAIPVLLSERAHLLSPEGQHAIARIQKALAEAPEIRAALPNASLGTWLEQVWLRLGGPGCVDAAARANLNLLWSCLDHLPAGEPDLLGRALPAALEKLTALPDPEAESDCGVHLMTIHKSKGLEFELVIVPDLQTKTKATRHPMIAWLERGLPGPEDSGEMTEFLVAPQQAKGMDRGTTKEWVDSLYAQRERQELRRLLYVAATRAREELHLFARVACKDNSEKPLTPPDNSLLATAWPALKAAAETQLESWKQPEQIEAETDEATPKPAILRRLPVDYELPALAQFASRTSLAGLSDPNAYKRHEGGLQARALGTAVHTFFAELARLCTQQDWQTAQPALKNLLPRIAAEVRASGIESAESERIAAQALEIVERASNDKNAHWILSPHVEAASETRWTGVLDGKLRTVQCDRVFRAGPEPHEEGDSVWWVVDYKTAHVSSADPASALPSLRKLFEPQLQVYSRVLRLLHGPHVEVRAGLYYPRMRLFDWWEI
jgi:ATP-dependent helicase/nuclease subunit A